MLLAGKDRLIEFDENEHEGRFLRFALIEHGPVFSAFALCQEGSVKQTYRCELTKRKFIERPESGYVVIRRDRVNVRERTIE
jgi:hypothetical protein